MKIKRLLSTFAALALIGSAPGGSAATVFSDDFESGALANWTTTVATPLLITNGQNVVPAAGTHSAIMTNQNGRMHRNLIADNGGSEVSGHMIFTYYLHDDGVVSRAWSEVRGYSGTGFPNGGTTPDGALSQLFAAGKFNSVTLPGETFSPTNYQARAGFTTNSTLYWFNLNGPGAPTRSTGWHRFDVERSPSSDSLNFYVDGVLARTVTDVAVHSIDSLILGPGVSTAAGTAWFDGVRVYSGAPTITTPPQPASVVAGGSVSFTVSQVGGFSYQWTHAGTNIPGATTSTLNLTGVHDGNAGDYAVIVSNAAGGTTSAAATLTVTHLPNIVFVSDNGPLGFSGALAGTADDSFVTFLQNAGYNVIRYNSPNTAAELLTASDIAALNTNDLIILGRSMGSAPFGAGQGNQWNTNITVPLIVQSAFLTRTAQLGWFNGSDANNRIPMPLQVVNTSDPENAYLFSSVAMNGSVTAGNFDEAVGQGTSHTFDAPVTGGNVLATGFGTNKVIVEFPAGTVVKGGADTLAGYRLFFASGSREPSGGTVPQAGVENLTATGESIFLRAVELALNGGVAPNLGQGPAFTQQPSSTNACAALPLTLASAATGQNPLSYQWYFSDGSTFTNALSQGTNASLSFASLDATNGGLYFVVVGNAVGSITSQVATVSIVGTGVVVSAIASQTNCPGSSVSFTANATGSGTLTYTWRKGDTIVQGPDGNNTFSIPSTVVSDSGAYSVTVVGDCNTVSNNFSLTVVGLPTISAQPQNQRTPMGNSASFSANASSLPTQPTTYQWLSNGVVVAGATTPNLNLSNLALSASGSTFQLVATTCAGSVTSAVATLTVTPISGISFDFNSPGQFTNHPYSMVYNDWLNSSFNTPPTIFETPISGVGPYPGGGGLDLIPNNGTVNSSILLPLSFDFSLPGKTLVGSAMVKFKSIAAAGRNTQIGFVTSTNADLDNSAGRSYMSVILQATNQPTVTTVDLRTGSKVSAANSFIEGNLTAAASLTVSNWYRVKATFVNNSAAIAGTYRVSATLENMGPTGTDTPVVVASINNVTITNADVVSARNLYFVVRGQENTGVENRDNFFAHSATGPIAFVQQPQPQTVIQGSRAVFRALVDGDGPYSYQWSKNGSPITGATSWKYVTPPTTTSDDGAQYSVTVTGPANSVTSDAAVLSVTPQTLAVVSAGSVDGTTVGIRFNQPVSVATAENPANYIINGTPAVAARVYRTSLSPQGPDGIYVVVTPASQLSGAFTVSVSGVQDLSGGSLGVNSTASGTVAGLTGVDVNSVTSPRGEEYSFGPGQFIVTGGGIDIWSNADSYRYVYTTVTGDFDVAARIPYADVVRSTSKVGFSVRPSLDPFSQQVLAAVNPMWPGRNFSEGTIRQIPNTASTSWGSSPTYNFAWFPDAWLRLRRVGNTFLRYSSTNGVNWNFDGQVSPNPLLPQTVHLGLAVCAAGNNNAMSAQFESFGVFAGYPGATLTLATSPTNFNATAGSSGANAILATVSGGGMPTQGEIAYIWQRNDGSGNFTNLVFSGATNNNVTIGPLFAADNGAQFRAIAVAPGAQAVTSAVFTASVTANDNTPPTIAAVNNGPFNAYPISEINVAFSEAMSAVSALDPANYAVTNAAGVRLTVLSVSFLNGDPRSVVLKLDGALGTGTATLGISGVRDLANNPVAATVRSFRTFAPPVSGPVVHEIYQDIGAINATASALTQTNLYTNGTPTLTVYSNVFGYNVGLGGQTAPVYPVGSTAAIENYGVKAYALFIPPTNGQYKFWIRSDDGMQLWMNTNGPDTIIANTLNSPAAQKAQNAVDRNVATKYLNFDKLNAGFSITTLRGTVLKGLRFTTAEDVPDRDPMTFIVEGTTGHVLDGPWEPIASGSTELTNAGRNVTGPTIAVANENTYTGYRIRFPTLRNAAAANSMQIAEVEFLDAAGNNFANAHVLIAENAANNATYSVGSTPANSRTNITLLAGQPYYIEALLKEGTGGDGFSVFWSDPSSNAAPAAANVIPLSALAYPAHVAPRMKAITELYLGYQGFGPNRATLQGLLDSTRHPVSTYPGETVNFKYIAGLPDVIGYQKAFATQPLLYDTRYNDYVGKMISYFVPPTNGNYKFWMRTDDVGQFYMNTNAANSTDPAGKRLMGQSGNVVAAGYQLVGSNVTLTAGQRYYIEVLWKEGGSGDGAALAVRAQGDNSVPVTPGLGTASPAGEVIPGSMLEFPTELSRSGAVNFDGIAGLTVADGSAPALSIAGLRGAPPYGGFTWYRNGEKVLENSFTNYLQPVTMADNGTVFTVVITNLFSTVSRTGVLTVLPDTNAPTVVQTVGSRFGDGFWIEFSEPLNTASAEFLGNYSVDNGLRLLTAKLDRSRRRVSFTTTPQAPGTTYTVTLTGVTDASSAANSVSAGTTATFSTWGFGGTGILVELFTNITGTAIADLTGSQKFADNLPDVVYYTNRFIVGTTNANSNLDNYGARVTAYYVPTNTGWYRFYLRSDDASQLYMNVQGENPGGKVLLIHAPSANISVQDPRSISPPVYLTVGQRYFMEALMKEGTGGDYLQLTSRETDSNGIALGGNPSDWEHLAASSFSSVPGNPDAIQIVSAPPAQLTVEENQLVTLSLVASIPTSMQGVITYQWQRFDGSTFTNIPGANAASYTFYAPLTDNGREIRVVFSAPGGVRTFATLMNVNTDVVAPFLVSANSLDGNTIGLLFNEPVEVGIANEAGNYNVNGGVITVLSAQVRTNIDPRTVVLTLQTPVTGTFEVEALDMQDLASTPNFGSSMTSGSVMGLTPQDVGGPLGAGSSFTATNGQVDIVAGGADIWGNADQGHMALGLRSGNFDVWARLHSLSRVTGDNDGITKAGIMVRETFDANSRKLHYLAEPPAAVGGRDIIEAGQRTATAGTTAAWSGGNGNNGVPAGIPNTWVRIRRVGDVFTAFRSSNGVDWVQTTTHSMSLSNSVWVGLAATAHIPTANANAAGTTLAQFRDVHIPLPPSITVQPSPAEQTVPIHSEVTYSVTGENPANSGPLVFQWRKNNRFIPGATNSTLTITNAGTVDSGVYTVDVGNNGGAVISDPVTLVVSNALPTAGIDSLTATQQVSVDINSSVLLANDNDPEGDTLSLLAVSGVAPVTFATDFNSGVPAGSAIYGTAAVDITGGVADSGVLKLTTAQGSQGGSFIVSNLTPGLAVSAFSARFKMWVSGGSANPADGFSFNFASDLPDAHIGGGEEGGGTGLTVAFDNYDNGGAEAPAIDIKWGGVVLPGASVKVPKIQAARFLDVVINLDADGTLDVQFDGTNVYSNLQVPYVPVLNGKFGLSARTGGEFEAHWVDDLSITVLTRDTAFGGRVALTNGVVNYTAGATACGSTDSFFYLASDGQVGGIVLGQVNVSVASTNLPSIVTCATNRTLLATVNCQVALPDMTTEVVTGCPGTTVIQSPAPGTLVGLGDTVVTLTASNANGTASCTATVTVIDGAAPVVTCPANLVVEATGASGAVVTFSPTAVDGCDANPVIVATPASGSTFPIGTTTVTVEASDAAGNTNTCTFTVTVRDTTGPAIACPANQTIVCNGTNAVANYTVTATDMVDPNPTVIVTPESGSQFAVGTNVVNVVAYDSAGNTNTCSFFVIVEDNAEPKLTLFRSGTDVTLKWPQTCAQWVLQGTGQFFPATWTNVNATVTVDGTNNSVTIPANSGTLYLRLLKQ
jgi:hypothetical protein